MKEFKHTGIFSREWIVKFGLSLSILDEQVIPSRGKKGGGVHTSITWSDCT
jgi:hypothetical protein